ncbi:hypothetical protein [Vibrio sp. CK2-1]|uniref:hypothetical protein n=1 Tax=Vibrio sp. CK2-1 TaxID=2912249 RepID=UPI001F21F74D|nr:hypothetical protein [Vibrio sp. CK2-1]MCF7354622.1 hypothetical protein [Vibrio sp. CK2-1]
MASVDSKFVNFSEDHELNGCLRHAGLRQTADNRKKLQALGAETKTRLDKKRLSHDDLYNAIDMCKNDFE